MSSEVAASQIRDTIRRLQSPIPDIQTLRALLAAPLDAIGLLPPHHRSCNTSPLPPGSFVVARHLPPLQRALLEHVHPTWGPALKEAQLEPLLEQYFVPDAFSYAIPAAGEVSLHAYTTLLSPPLTPYAIDLLARLSRAYPVDRLHATVFSGRSFAGAAALLAWDDAVKNVLSVPAKVANALGGRGDIPLELEQGHYYENLCLRSEALMHSLALGRPKESMPSLTYLFTKLVNVGAFPSAPPTAPSQPSFFHSALPAIRARLRADADRMRYSALWAELFVSLPSSLTLQSILTSLFGHVAAPASGLDASSAARGLVKREAGLLRGTVGELAKESSLWESVGAAILSRDWSEGHARIFACWAAGAQTGSVNEGALDALLSKTLDMWSSPEHIKHSLLSRHHYVTLLLLATIAYLPPASAVLADLALSPPFIRSIGTYIGHLDPSVRRCGMLVAEEVAHRTGKQLDFGDWEGDEGGKAWARGVRALLAGKDADADADDLPEDTQAAELGLSVEELLTDEIFEPPDSDFARARASASASAQPGGYDSDDSVTGYASPASSSRTPSPTPSELDEYEKDPTVRMGRDKIQRPVYLAQLGQMIRNTSGLKSEQENQEADKIEVGLAVAEELIRRKRAFGTELEENAVNLVYGFVGLQDNFEITEFDRKRQAALNALVACCPRKAAPAVIEEFFKNQYSTDQRYVMLNALALGARELAGMPLPPTAPVHPLVGDRVAFPSKRLPAALHDRYLTASDAATGQVRALLRSISAQAIENTKDAHADEIPELARTRRLRLRQPQKVTELSPHHPLSRPSDSNAQSPPPPQTTFADVAVASFIYPLVNRFWLFLRDEQTREERTAHRDALHRYRGAGTGLVLNPVVLVHFLATLGVLVHAARNAPEWPAIVAPDALELALTIGTRPVSLAPEDDDEDDDNDNDGDGGGGGGTPARGESKEARVLATALELALIVLDGSLEIDAGRSLGLEHTALLLAVGEWAGTVFRTLEQGVLVRGGGGAAEARLSKAAAGVVIKVGELSDRWRRSMIDVAL